MIDGRQATIIAREYFTSAHGAFAVWNFEVEEVKHTEKNGVWSVTCGFHPTMFAVKKSRYTVLVSDDEQIRDVTKLE